MSNYKKDELARFAMYFKALSSPHRLQIFTRLVRECGLDKVYETDEDYNCCVGDLGNDLDLAPSTVSHHIKELCKAGLMETRKSGKNVRCWISSEIISELSGFFLSRCSTESPPSGTVNINAGNKVLSNE